MSNVITFPRPPIEQAVDLELNEETVAPMADRIHSVVHNMTIDEIITAGKGQMHGDKYRLNYAWIAMISQGVIRHILEEVMDGAADVETLEVLREDFINDINNCFEFFAAEKREN